MSFAVVLLGIGLVLSLSRPRRGASKYVVALCLIVVVLAAEALKIHAT